MAKGQTKTYVGVDVGGTKIEAGLVRGRRVLRRHRLDTDARRGTKAVLKNISAAVAAVLPGGSGEKVDGIGVGATGLVDAARGVVVSSANLPRTFRDIELAKALRWTFRVPVKVENDAAAFALAEAVYGAGAKAGTVVGLTLGTGIGGGIVVGREIFRGAHGAAGEFGHTIITDHGASRRRELRGRLESQAAGPAIVWLYQRLGGSKKLDERQIAARVRRDAKAAEVFKLMSDALATGLANITVTLDPDVIVIGGGLRNVSPLVTPAIKLARERLAHPYPQLAKIKIVRSRLKDSHLLGPALLFR